MHCFTAEDNAQEGRCCSYREYAQMLLGTFGTLLFLGGGACNSLGAAALGLLLLAAGAWAGKGEAGQ